MDTVDPFIPLYAFEKSEHPDKRFVLRQFNRKDVMDVDHILEVAGHNREAVKTDEDWKIVEMLANFYVHRWPDEYKEFASTVPDIRHTRNSKGYSQSKEIKYVGAMPVRLMKIIQIIFPYQQFDKKFVNKLVKRLPLLEVGGAV